MTTPARVLISGIVAAALIVCLAGCGNFRTVCTTIGYIHTATLEITGPGVADLRLCQVDICAASNDVRPPAPEPTLATPEFLASTLATPRTGRGAGFTVSKQNSNSFSFSGVETPRSLEAHALDASGAEIGKTTVTLTWKRINGSEQCGGTNTASATLRFD